MGTNNWFVCYSRPSDYEHHSSYPHALIGNSYRLPWPAISGKLTFAGVAAYLSSRLAADGSIYGFSAFALDGPDSLLLSQ